MLGHDLVQTFHHEDIIALGSQDLDITQKDKVREKFFTLQPDIVINATGYTKVDLAEEEEEKANAVNGYGVGILAKTCREIEATLIHFSTDYVFHGDKPQGYQEEDQTNPLNAYGRSKALGEKLLIEEMELLNQDNPKEGRYFIIRTSWLFGHHGKNFVETMLNLGKTAKKETPLKVVNDQHGNPTFTLDLCQQLQWLLQSHEYPSGVYHITNEGATTWYDFAREIFRLAKMEVPMLPCASGEYPRPAKRPLYSILHNNKLPPLRPWQEALEKYLDN